MLWIMAHCTRPNSNNNEGECNEPLTITKIIMIIMLWILARFIHPNSNNNEGECNEPLTITN